MNAEETDEAVKAIPYPEGWVNKEEYHRLRAVYQAAVGEVTGKFKAWLGDNYAGDLPQGIRDMIWGKAWEDGHSSGYYVVEQHYGDYADFASSIFHIGRASK
jgi:hypothetical protein